MNKRFLPFILVLITSCSSFNALEELAINCVCEVSMDLVTIRQRENNIKKVSFTNSELFDLGISKERFALSSAILINDYFKIDPEQMIKVNIVNDDGRGEKEIISYSYEQNEIEALSTKYFEILSIIDGFVMNIYERNFSACKSMTSIPVETAEFNSVMEIIHKSIENGYIDTRILSLNVGEGEYNTYGGILLENKMLNIFKMHFAETEHGLKIIAFSF